ncbi:unnamed protein product [Enterobius vermicularis]|uniref:GPI ethanolamine phosphate transferase 1 n=1 Tax=Enterobius vermicularis TaxID=51028 RepID=A0A0N4USH4_ENTVE|nr:unnamed protein product [Enterobius vermicularis]
MFSNHHKLVVLGVIVHVILLYSIFDIYYTSPLVRGTQPHPITKGDGPAKRLVIISADGLRSDVFFQHPEKSPFLHRIIRTNTGCWGISASHVPTESRPGHVALLAGFYEDVSAVARGWKLNPVPFDSMINRSYAAWAWGSPDIVPMFTKNVKHASAFVYPSHLEDFYSLDAAELDRWVFKKVEDFVQNIQDQRIFLDKAVFFLHLLGLDTNGHGYKPHSDKYIDNIRIVDEGLEKVEHLFEGFFRDNRTAYIFVSDHGMTDWGSHGAGTDAEVLTPFVFWGAGVKNLPKKMAINQVDTTPLMAALLGVAIPMNNVGVLPHECLDANAKYIFQSSYANFKQVIFVSEQKTSGIVPILNLYEAAFLTCLHWIPYARAGLLYFHRYERSTLGFATTLSFTFWAIILYLYSFRLVLLILFEDFGVSSILFFLSLPFSHSLYILLPIYLASVALNINESLAPSSSWRDRIKSFYYANQAALDREILRKTVGRLGIFLYRFRRKAWFVLCLILATFPQLPAVGQSPSPLLCISSPVISCICLFFISSKPYFLLIARTLRILSVIHFLVAVTIAITELYGDLSKPILLLLRIFCWISLPASFVLPLTAPNLLIGRLICWFSSLYIPYALLSLSYESFFLLLFYGLLIVYVRTDMIHVSDESSLTLWGRSILTAIFIEIGFFGTGNVASLNSFNPSFLRCFLSVFSPFVMTALLIFKVTLPFLAISFALTVVLHAQKASPVRLSIILLIITDAMAVVFFFRLVDDGSWLEIGMSISHYVISMLTSVVVFLLLQCAQYLLFSSLCRPLKKHDLPQFPG